MPSMEKPFWQPVALVLGAALVAPLFLFLLLGRIVFFGALSLCEAVQQRVEAFLDRPAAAQSKAGLLPFWLAWLMAVLLLAGSLAGGILVVARTADWAAVNQFTARGIFALLAIAALYFAFRLALSGTNVLQRVLAHNLARLIAFELDELRAQADQRVQYLAVHGLAIDALEATTLPSSSALPVPHFFQETDDIAKLLGAPTERALEDLLLSLMAFNNAIQAASADRLTRGAAARQQAHLHLRRQLIQVHAHLTLAIHTVNPLCRRGI